MKTIRLLLILIASSLALYQVQAQTEPINPESVTTEEITITDLTGYMKANGSSPATASATIPWTDITGTPTTNVTAASTFATDNRLLRSDGTSRGSQSSAITVDDSGNISGVGSFSAGAINGTTGNFTGTVTGVASNWTGLLTINQGGDHTSSPIDQSLLRGFNVLTSAAGAGPIGGLLGQSELSGTGKGVYITFLNKRNFTANARDAITVNHDLTTDGVFEQTFNVRADGQIEIGNTAFVDASRNVTAGTISGSGITTTTNEASFTTTGSGIVVNRTGSDGLIQRWQRDGVDIGRIQVNETSDYVQLFGAPGYKVRLGSNGSNNHFEIGTTGTVSISGSDFVDASRNVTAGTISATSLTLSGATASTLAYFNGGKLVSSVTNGTGWLYNNGSGTFSFGFSANSNRITSVADPVDDQDAVTKAYLEANSGTSRIHKTTVTVTSAQIKNSFTSPIELISTPGAGNFITIHRYIVSIDFASIAYTIPSGSSLLSFGSGGVVNLSSQNTVITSTSDAWTDNVPQTSGLGINTHANEGLYFRSTSSNPTNGDSDIKISIWYTIESL